MEPVIKKSNAEIAIDKLITNVGKEAIYNEWNNSTLNTKKEDVKNSKDVSSKDAKHI
jgi:hypothetical protein